MFAVYSPVHPYMDASGSIIIIPWDASYFRHSTFTLQKPHYKTKAFDESIIKMKAENPI